MRFRNSISIGLGLFIQHHRPTPQISSKQHLIEIREEKKRLGTLTNHQSTQILSNHPQPVSHRDDQSRVNITPSDFNVQEARDKTEWEARKVLNKHLVLDPTQQLPVGDSGQRSVHSGLKVGPCWTSFHNKHMAPHCVTLYSLAAAVRTVPKGLPSGT